jgi:hypothetical protein
MTTATDHYPNAGWYLRNCREAFRVTAAGHRFRMGHAGEYGEYGPDGDRYVKPWRREFLDALDRRMNAHGGLPVATAKWRRLDPDWQASVWRLARAVNTPRLVVRIAECPKEYRVRLAHRLTDPTTEVW